MAALVVLALLGIVPMGASTHEDDYCARTAGTILIGTGDAGIDLAALDGVNHKDLAHPKDCSGRAEIDHSSGAVRAQQHCSAKFLRVYADAGTVGQDFVIKWMNGPGCA